MNDVSASTANAATTAEVPKPPIHVNFDNKLDYKAAKFGFRTVEDEKTGVKTKRNTIELTKIPVPSVEGIIAILDAGGKQLDLLLEAVSEVVFSRIRDYVNDNEGINSENFNYAVADWNNIANLEKEDRRSAFPKELIEDFTADYVSVMPSVSGGEKAHAVNAAKIFAGKFNSIKSKKDVIAKLKLRLALYADHSPKAAEFAEWIDFLFKKADKLITAKEENLVDNLGLD